MNSQPLIIIIHFNLLNVNKKNNKMNFFSLKQPLMMVVPDYACLSPLTPAPRPFKKLTQAQE